MGEAWRVLVVLVQQKVKGPESGLFKIRQEALYWEDRALGKRWIDEWKIYRIGRNTRSACGAFLAEFHQSQNVPKNTKKEPATKQNCQDMNCYKLN